jgi:ABC-type branched-subunit amino acid transport system substrate-binding protein
MNDMSMLRPCVEWAETLALVQDDDLSSPGYKALREHLQSCVTCATVLEEYRLMDIYLKQSLRPVKQSVPQQVKAPELVTQAGWRLILWFAPRSAGIAAGAKLFLFAFCLCILLFGIGLAIMLILGRSAAFAIISASFIVAFVLLFGRKIIRSDELPGRKPGGWREKGSMLLAALSLLAVSLASTGLTFVDASQQIPGRPIGLSDGGIPLDIHRADGQLKQQAAVKFAADDIQGAMKLWQKAIEIDSSDAEASIYLEDYKVLAAHQPYVTIVVGTIIVPPTYVSGGRDDLQAAFLAQKEHNDQVRQSGGVLLRLLIAVARFDNSSPAIVAQQVVQAMQQDPTIIGLAGWPTSTATLAAYPILSAAHIPMVSGTSSSDELIEKSPYLFKVSPSNDDQEIMAAAYLKSIGTKNIALFVDPHDSYSKTLAKDLIYHFVDGEHTIVVQEQFTGGQAATIQDGARDALAHHPEIDAIFFAGFASDASTLLRSLPVCQFILPVSSQCPIVFGGDALYLQRDYVALKNFTRLRFSVFAYESSFHSPLPFYQNFARCFDPNGRYEPGTYGHNLPEGHTELAYNAMLVLLNAVSRVWEQGITHISPLDLERALEQVDPVHPVQGVSGPIAFDVQGNNVYKRVMILAGQPDGQLARVWP